MADLGSENGSGGWGGQVLELLSFQTETGTLLEGGGHGGLYAGDYDQMRVPSGSRWHEKAFPTPVPPALSSTSLTLAKGGRTMVYLAK